MSVSDGDADDVADDDDDDDDDDGNNDNNNNDHDNDHDDDDNDNNDNDHDNDHDGGDPPPVLVPGLDLRVCQRELGGQLHAVLHAEVFLALEGLLQAGQLVVREGRARLARLLRLQRGRGRGHRGGGRGRDL